MFEAVANYGVYGTLPDFTDTDPNGLLDGMFLQIRFSIDEAKAKRSTNRENGSRGGAPKGNKNACKNNRKQPNSTENKQNNPNVNVNVNVNDNVIIKQKKKTLVSPDWKPKDTTVAKLTEKGLDADRVVDKFINSCIAKNLKYIDFDRAILTWDWSKDASLRVKNENIAEDWYL